MSPEHEFPIAVGELDAGGKSVTFPVRASWMRGALEGTDVAASGADGALALRISKSGNDVVVRGTLRAEIVVPCGRCLEPARVKIDETLSALMVPRGALREAVGGEGDDDEAAAGDADVLAYDGETVVLDDLVRDELLLAIPMIPLCSEACPGISPRSGEPPAEASIDPRLRPLLRLKKS